MTLELSPLHIRPAGQKRPTVIAGPCSAESEEQVMNTAKNLSEHGIHIFRAGIWKPRTKPGGFEGVGEIGMPWLKRVQKELGMLITTEVATPVHVETALRWGLDLIWVGARTMANPFAVQDLADALKGSDIPVLCKNPVNPDLELWIGGLERLNRAGVKRLGVIHRGFSTYEKHLFRNEPMWHVPIELRRRYPDLPIFVDPSHIGGKRDLVAPLSQQAMDLGFDGLIIETHCQPEHAWSDASQQITPDTLKYILDHLVIREAAISSQSLSDLRRVIDNIDNEIVQLLIERMHISQDIGRYKRANNMAAIQTQRYNQLIDQRAQQGKEHGLTENFIKTIFEAIHEESVRQQLDILNQ